MARSLGNASEGTVSEAGVDVYTVISNSEAHTMPFEAKSLRVQLPCRSLTVIDGEAFDRERKARKTLRDIITPRLTSPTPCCARATGEEDCIRGSHDVDIANLTDHLCMGTDALETRFTVEASVLPALRVELERRLEEVRIAEDAVARHMNEGVGPSSSPSATAAKKSRK